MQLLLQEGEQIVKSRDYARSKERGAGGDKQTARLTVTNKRVIHTVDGKKSFSHSEVPIDKVKTISGSCKRANNTLLLVLGILFILCLVTAIIGIILLVLWSKAPSTVELSLDLEGRRATAFRRSAAPTTIKSGRERRRSASITPW